MQTLLPLTLGLQLSPWMVGVMVVVFVLVSVMLMLTILIQKPQGGGLSAAFGAGAGSGQTAFGTKTGDALTIATISIFALWVLCGVGLNFALAPTQAATQTTTIGADEGEAAPAGGAGHPPVRAPRRRRGCVRRLPMRRLRRWLLLIPPPHLPRHRRLRRRIPHQRRPKSPRAVSPEGESIDKQCASPGRGLRGRRA